MVLCPEARGEGEFQAMAQDPKAICPGEAMGEPAFPADQPPRRGFGLGLGLGLGLGIGIGGDTSDTAVYLARLRMPSAKAGFIAAILANPDNPAAAKVKRCPGATPLPEIALNLARNRDA